MTTIAYSHKFKQVAVDSRSTTDSMIRSDNSDKTICNDRGIWVFCGSKCDHYALSTLKHNDHCEVIPDSYAIRVSKGVAYAVQVNSSGYCEETILKYDFTMGSGQEFAISALDFGKSPEEAVKYAMTRDFYTGGNVQVINLDDF